jgi:hypothetical protein
MISKNPPTECARVFAVRTALVLLVVTARPAPTWAQEPAAQGAGARAIERGNEGIALYEHGKWNEALERFKEAEALYHSPVFVLYTARSLRNTGRLLEARDTLQRLLAEKLDRSAPEQWKKAQADAREELIDLQNRVPSALIQVDGGSASTRLTVDERQVAPGGVVELDPGAHRAVATDGGRSKTENFTLAPGEQRRRVVLQLASATAPMARDQAGLYVPGLILAGVGGAAMITGGVFGVLALNEKADVRDNLPAGCDGTTCPRSKQGEIEDRIDSARNLGTAADVLLISGAAVAATGIGLMIWAPGQKPAIAAGMSHRGGFVRMRF